MTYIICVLRGQDVQLGYLQKLLWPMQFPILFTAQGKIQPWLEKYVTFETLEYTSHPYSMTQCRKILSLFDFLCTYLIYFHCWGYDFLCTYLILYMKTKTCLFLSSFDQSRYSELARNDMNKFAYKAMKLNRKAGEQSPRLYDLSFPT